MPFIDDSIRDKHIHVIGSTGGGKSTLLHWYLWNDIKSGKGVCLIDPKGDLAESIVRFIPDDRIDDCVWLDLDHPIPLDFMACEPGQEESVVDDLRYILTNGVSIEHAHTVNANVENLIYALLDANQNIPRDEQYRRATFLDIYDFLEDKQRREYLLRHVSNSRLKNKWTEDFPSSTDRGRITSRMTRFINSNTLKTIFGEPKPRLNIQDIIEDRRILIVKCPVKAPSAAFYGAMLVAKIQQYAFSRHNTPEHLRTPFYLYIDEFQNFRASDAFDKAIKMARGYKLCLTLSHLEMAELDDKVRSAIGIMYTKIIFSLNPSDRPFFSDLLGQENDQRSQLAKRAERLDLDLATKSLNPIKSTEMSYELRNIRNLLKGFDDVPTVHRAIHLPDYRAIYKMRGQPAVEEPTPEPPDWYIADEQQFSPEQDRKAEYIKKRTVDKYACDIKIPVLKLTEDVQPRPDDAIQVSPAAIKDVPPHGNKARRPPRPR